MLSLNFSVWHYVIVLNPNPSLDSKLILYKYQLVCLSLQRQRSRLRQGTKTDTMLIRKYKALEINIISKLYEHCNLLTDSDLITSKECAKP